MKYDFRAAVFGALTLTGIASAVILAPAYAGANTEVSAASIASVIEANPDIVGNALIKLQQRSQMQEQDRAAQTLAPVARAILKGDPLIGVVGNPKGSRQVVEFFDYNCGYCKVFATRTLGPMLASDPQLKVHLVQTPILGPGSRRMAEFAAAAQMQGPVRYRAAHDWLIGQRAGTVADAERLKSGLIAAARLDGAAFDRALANRSAARIVDHNAALAEKAGVNGTPAIYAGGRAFRGMIDGPTLKAALSGR